MRAGTVNMAMVLVTAAVVAAAWGCEGGKHYGKTAPAYSSAKLELSGEVVQGVRVVEVTAMKYKFVPGTIVVGEGEKVRLEVTATDTTHGFQMGDFKIKQTLEKGKKTDIEFTAGAPGKHAFKCFVYCGLGHGKMKGELVVIAKK